MFGDQPRNAIEVFALAHEKDIESSEQVQSKTSSELVPPRSRIEVLLEYEAKGGRGKQAGT